MAEPVWNAALQAYDDGQGHIWRTESEGWIPKPSSGGGSTTAPMGYAGTGTQILNDEAQRQYWAGLLANSKEQNTNAAAANQNSYNLGLAGINAQNQGNQNSYNLGMAGLAQQATAMQNSYNTAKAQFELEGVKAQQLYQMDVARLGVEVANANYQQRLGDATIRLQQAQIAVQGSQFELSQNQFNSQQRKDLADRKYQITKDLADRRGPENIVGYMRLLNGLDTGNPNVTTVDPFAGLSDLYKESTIATPKAPDIPNITQPVAFNPPAAPTMPSFPAYSAGSTTMPAYTQAAPLPQYVPPSGNLAAPTNTQQAAATPAPAGATGPAGAAPTPVPSTGYPTEGGTTTTGRRPVTIDPNVAPDASGYRWDSANQEWVDPNQGNAPYRPMAQGGTSSGPVLVGDSKSGKTTGHEEMVFASINPETGAAETTVIPHEDIAHLLGERMGRKGGQVVDIRKFPKGMAAMIPRAASGGTFGSSGSMGSLSSDPSLFTSPITQQQMVAPPAAPQQPQTGGGYPVDPNPTMAPAPTPTTPTNTSTIPFTPPPIETPTAPTPAPLPGNPNAPGTYGSDLNDQVYRFYDYSTQLGNQPFIQKLTGGMASRPYGGFGATLSNPKIGAYNVPTALNLKNWFDLQPTEQTAARNFYEQGLGTNLDDFLAQSQRAAPLGQTLAGARYGS